MLTVERDFGRIFGILTEPAGDPAPLAVIALNAGALNHTGPNRMWVEAARRWAARGVTTLRLDVEGIGDADGDGSQWTDVGSFYVPSLVVQVRAAMDELERRAIAGRFLLLGLCSGAYWAFHAGAQDERVAAALMVNPRTLLWDVRHHEAREARRIRRVTSPQALRRLTPRRAGEVLGAVAARAARAPVARREERERLGRLDAAFDALSDRGCRATMLFTGDEPLWEEMAADGRVPAGHWPNVSVELLSPAPETHTLRPPGLQRLVHERLDAALERELDLAARES
jgi:dienelactone hydrolase